jgi:hypothetical protein
MLTSKCSPLETAGLVGASRRRSIDAASPDIVGRWPASRPASDSCPICWVAEHAVRLDVVTGGLLHTAGSLYLRGGPTLGGSAVADQL